MTDAYFARGTDGSFGGGYAISDSPRLTALPVRPTWLLDVGVRLEELAELRADWDSYGAPPISGSIIQTVLEALADLTNEHSPEPHVVPTTRGGIQLEWEIGDLEAELEFLSAQKAEWYLCDARTEEEEETEVSLVDLTELRSKLGRLERAR